jgi:hypothetical protein
MKTSSRLKSKFPRKLNVNPLPKSAAFTNIRLQSAKNWGEEKCEF